MNFIVFSKSLLIYQRPQIHTIAPSDQFQRIQISAELVNAVTIHDYSSLFTTIRTVRTILYFLIATVCHYSHYSYYYSLFAIRDYSLLVNFVLYSYFMCVYVCVCVCVFRP